ncbi:GntR family transcriptional regulator [Kocuria dechangensis]|uniref:GntR family transcriptional regulator n=1 Tax=Kocuria dechangensis TaxID=1176249 RepID=A0A917LZH8_9MICC|nr:GntR family transcriptional regulator [Kocuria dechangensis]
MLVPGTRGASLAMRVRQTVERLIVGGTWRPGERVPSSRSLAEDLGVSRTTVQSAYQALVDEGYLLPSDRRGMYVSTLLPYPAVAERQAGTGYSGTPDWEHAVDWERVLHRPRTGPWPELRRERTWHRFDYPFVTGQHDSSFFPREAWLRALKRALGPEHRHASLDDVLDDDARLVDILCTRVLPGRGLSVSPDNVLVTLGSQQGLHLLAASTIRWGDSVAVENPGYIDARHVFHRAGATIVDVPVDEHGLVPQSEYSGARLLFVTPSHQHPTNVTLSVDRRLQLIQQAQEQDFLIVEDDYDSELRYRGQPHPAMAALDPSGRTVYLGTMSKVLAPGLRIGYVVGPKALLDELRTHRRYAHRQPPGHLQRAVALLYESGDFARAQRRYKNDLARRWDTAAKAAERMFSQQQVLPPGGTGLWIRTDPTRSANELVDRARDRGILVDPGSMYFSDSRGDAPFIRVGFGAIPHQRITPGMELLASIATDQARPN